MPRFNCCKKKIQGLQKEDEYVGQDVILLQATLLETRAKFLLRGGHFVSLAVKIYVRLIYWPQPCSYLGCARNTSKVSKKEKQNMAFS